MTDWFGAVSPFAQAITVSQRGCVRECRAFIQPVSLTAPDSAPAPAPPGLVDERRYLIIAAPDAFDGLAGGTVVCGQRRFEVLRCELMGGGSHWEGLLRLKAGDCRA